MGICEKICLFFKSITVEPAYLTFAISQGLYLIVSSELYISKVCKVNLNYSDEICDHIQQHKEEQVEVQKYVSTLKIYNSILQSIPAVLFALFAGPWSDTNGRKFLIMSSLFGFVFNNAVFMINTYWFYELKAEYLLFECLQDCTGGFTCFFMSVNSYMADITAEKNRTKRVAFMSGLWPVGFNIGKALSGVIKSRLGFMYNFAIGMLMSLFAMVYVMIFVKDSIEIREKRLKQEREAKLSALGLDANVPDDQLALQPRPEGIKKVLSLFDIKNLISGVRALKKKRKFNMRPYLILMIVCFEMEMFINVGEWSGTYLYLRRSLDFTMGDYTRYSTIVGVIGIIAQYITIPILSEKLKLRDSTIVMIDITGCFIQTIIIACAKTEWMLYLGAVIAFLDATSFSMIRCMISKHVEPDEIGKLLSFVGAFQAFIPIISSPLFGLLYKATVETFPQAYLIALAFLFFVDWVFLLIIDIGLKRIDKKKEKIELQGMSRNTENKEKLLNE